MTIQQMLLGGAGESGYNLTRSLRFRASASARLNRTPAAGNRQIWTYSTWVKRGTFGGDQYVIRVGDFPNLRGGLFFDSQNNLRYLSNPSGSSDTANLISTAVYRDPSAWYHVVLALDSTQATAANRVKLYVNGVQVTAFGTATYPPLNENGSINAASIHYIGFAGATYFDGYMAEVNFIDGQALTPSSFGSTNDLTGVWQPARYTGTYGTNGFYLPFTDNSTAAALGTDFSGNSNTWTVNNISVTAGVTYDSMTDVPTLTSATAANYAVLNPLANNAGGAGTLANANLQISVSSTNCTFNRPLTVSVASGQWYIEATLNSDGNQQFSQFGVISEAQVSTSGTLVSFSTGYAITVSPSFSNFATGNNNVITQYGARTSGAVVGQIAFDASAGKIWLGVNGVWFGGGDPALGTTPTYSGLPTTNWFFALFIGNIAGANVCHVNCGQRPFAYTPPTGFVALNTFNLPASTIVKGNTVMDATLYTGTLLSNSITNAAGFQPDLVWIKSRSAATDHELTDSVRGATLSLTSNSTAAEATDVQGLTAFNSGGFTVGTNTNYNNLAATYVGWQWKAGGAAVSNTDGTITSQVSVNASAGFSVVTYTGSGVAGATVGHGLGVAPKFIYTITRSPSGNVQQVYHSSIGNTGAVFMNSTQGTNTAINWWNNTSPTSSVFSLGNGSFANGSGSTMVAYCWAEIDGFSKFGSYVGNSNADGPFIYCGFRPKFVLFKGSSFDNNWYIIDSATNTINVAGAGLIPNANSAETATSTTQNAVDFLSNGFKLRNNAAAVAFNNSSGQTFIFAAFAENPFKFSLAR